MKGAVAAFTTAAGFFAADRGRDFAGEIWVAGVVHEECFEGVAAREISACVKPDYVIIGEASQLNIKIGQRGRGEIVVETFGVPAHSANPEKGVNAVYAMCRVVEALRIGGPGASGAGEGHPGADGYPVLPLSRGIGGALLLQGHL